MKKLNPSLFIIIALIAMCFPSIAHTQTPISNFGSNPGGINAYQYIPANMPANAPLVIVLHGCTQTASSYSIETQWNDLADRHKFYVTYGEQTSTNNSTECFNYFLTADNSRGQGECLSIKQITDYMKNNYSIDSTRVFVTGLSAGAAMTTVMCCTYPDVFAAGAEMSGLPYGCATSLYGADLACLGDVTNTPQGWGNLARAQNPGYTDRWPRMAIFHGTADAVVSIKNDTEVIKQFTNLHNCGQTVGYIKSSFNANSLVQQEQFFDSSGRIAVEYYTISGMSHGTAVYPGTCYQQGGSTDDLSFNEQLYSPFWAAQFFGILQLPYSMTGLTSVTISQHGLSYSVPNTAGSVYTWTVPPGVTIISGQGTNTITVNWGTISGMVSVTEMPTGGCELGPVQLFVTASQAAGANGRLSNITEPAGTICSSSFAPSLTLTNTGADTLIRDSIFYFVDQNAVLGYVWTGSLPAGDSVHVTLPTISTGAGNHTLIIISSAPNGDINITNDTVTTNFTTGVPPVVNLGNNVSQCGGIVTLNALNSGDTYTWSNGATTQTISVSQSGNYKVTVAADGCQTADSITVTIKPVPVINLTGGNFCASQTTLNAGNSGAGYLWSNSATTETIAVTSSGSYAVTVTNQNNCTASQTVTVNLNSNPAVNLGTGGNVCGNFDTLDAGNPGSVFQWSNGATSQTITATASGSYSVTVTGGPNCSSSASVNITLNPNPVVNLGNDTSVCGSSLVLNAQNQGASFMWSNSATTASVIALNTGMYSVTVTGAANCSASASVNITLNPNPVVSLGNDTSVCGSLALNAQNQGASFAWSNGATTESINASGTGMYTVTVTGAASCSASAFVNVVINPLPNVILQLPHDSLCQTAGSVSLQGANPQGGAFSGPFVSNGSFNATAAGPGSYIIIYSYTDANNCTASDSENITVDICTTLKVLNTELHVTVFPNPSQSGVLNIHVDQILPGLKAKIFDALGNMLSVYNVNELNSHFNISTLSQGIYMISIESGDIALRKKFIVQY